MRKMPGGQWVAFEGYDTIHDCQKPQNRDSSNKKPYQPTKSNESSYESLNFPEIKIGQQNIPTGLPRSTNISTSTDKKIQAPSSRATQPNTTTTKVSSWIWWGVAIIIICVFASTIGTMSSLSTSNTPTARPYTTATLKPRALSPVDIAATQNADCLSWNRITASLEGQLKCVYGNVVQRKTLFSSDNSYSWFLVRFDDNPSTFYITSDITLDIKVGDCIMAKAKVLVDFNGVPNMKVDSLFQCT